MTDFIFQFIDSLINLFWGFFGQMIDIISDILNYLLSAQL